MRFHWSPSGHQIEVTGHQADTKRTPSGHQIEVTGHQNTEVTARQPSKYRGATKTIPHLTVNYIDLVDLP
jgi:hypothetical protein